MTMTSRDADIAKMLVAKTHMGTKNLEHQMEHYVWRRTKEGVHLINLSKTWEKLMLAARVLVAIENPADICVVSARPYGSRAVLKFAHYTGATAEASRWTPGTFTNQITKKFMEPRVLIVTDPRTDSQAVRECSYANIPVIAFCDTDAPLNWVDIVIPCNNKTVHSIGLMYWLLSREVLRLRGALPRDSEWEEMPDMFFWKDPNEIDSKNDEGDADAPHQAAGANWGATPTAAAGEWNATSDWNAPAPAAGAEWGAEAVVDPAKQGGW